MYQQIEAEKLVPNTWNPNKLHGDLLGKLENGLVETLAKAGKLPPITVRPHPSQKGKFEIIDGYHRWTLLKKLGKEKVDAFILTVDDSLARVLTATLNYIRGEADPEKYPLLVAEAIKANPDLKLEDLAKLLPETKDQLEEIVASSDAAMTALAEVIAQREKDGDAASPEPDPEKWVTLSFNVPLDVAGIVERELDRIAACLDGKQRRMRALEYMAVNSSLTPLDGVEKQIALKKKQTERKEQVKAKDAGFASDVETELKAVATKSKKPATSPKKPKAAA